MCGNKHMKHIQTQIRRQIHTSNDWWQLQQQGWRRRKTRRWKAANIRKRLEDAEEISMTGAESCSQIPFQGG